MRPLSLALLLLLAAPGVARAGDLCADVERLMADASSGFAASPALAEASDCEVTATGKKRVYQCSWEHPHRAAEAYAHYDAFVQELDGCLGPQTTPVADQSVNHPDFFALRRYPMPGADVSVSVKDKSALNRTFVFLRIQAKVAD